MEDLNLRIDANYFANWVEVEITLSIDTFSTFSFSAPFVPERPEFRSLFQPFTFRRVQIDSNLEPDLIDGYIVDIAPKFDPNGATIQVTGYSRPAVLCDCCIPGIDHRVKPPKIWNRQFNKSGLLLIAQQCCAPFGIGVVFDAPEGNPFDKVRIDSDKKVHEFLVDLAKQRNLVISNTRDGKLLFQQSVDTGSWRATFVEGKAPLKTVETQFSPREYFSEITGHAVKKRGKKPTQWTEYNPYLASPRRPHFFKLEDTDRAEAPDATQAKMGRMFANMVTWTIPDLPTWRDPAGKLWEPNTTIMLRAPSAMVYRETELLIRTVKLKKTRDEETATLECVLPGAFSGKAPVNLPWSERNEFEEQARRFFE